MDIDTRKLPAGAASKFEDAEIKIAVQSRMPFKNGFEAAVREALEPLGGSFLFQIPGGPDDAESWTAAVLFGGDGDAQFGLITISGKDGINVETAEQSHNPIAKIVPAYFAVMAQLQPAA